MKCRTAKGHRGSGKLPGFGANKRSILRPDPRPAQAVAWRRRRPVATSRAKRKGLRPNRYCAQLAVPLRIKEEIYGGLILYYVEPRKFSAEEIELAVMYGDQAVLAIENARLRLRWERTAMPPNATASPGTCTIP